MKWLWKWFCQHKADYYYGQYTLFGIKSDLIKAERWDKENQLKQTLRNELNYLINLFENADRMGGEKDEPEGTRYIQISDTLASELVKELVYLLAHN